MRLTRTASLLVGFAGISVLAGCEFLMAADYATKAVMVMMKVQEEARKSNEGEPQEGEPHEGEPLVLADGSRYEGDLRKGRPHGRGTMAYPGGDRYEGQWRDGKRHDRGTVSLPGGVRYAGEWRAGRIAPETVKMLASEPL